PSPLMEHGRLGVAHRGSRLGRLLMIAAVAAATAVLAPAAEARDATIRSFDQTAINPHFFPAAGLAAGKRAPTVMVGPGWSQPGETDENSSSDELFGGVGVGA